MATDHNFKVKNGLTVESISVQIEPDGYYTGYSTLGFGGVNQSYSRIFAQPSTSSHLYIHSSGNLYFRTNGSGSNKYVIDASGNFIHGSTTIIDSSRNLTNIGNIASNGVNAISTKVVLGGSSFSNMSNSVSVAIGSAWMGSSASLFVNGFSRYNGNLYISDGGSTNYVGIGYSNGKVGAVGGNGSGINAFNAPDGYYVANTQVIDSSRNLVNIGEITASGDTVITGSGASGNALTVKRGNDSTTAFYVLNTGEVVVPSNYFYVSASQGAYFTGSIKARGGITNDGGNNLDLSSPADITIKPAAGSDVLLFNAHNSESQLRLYNNRQDLSNVPVSSIVAYNSAQVSKMVFYRGGGGSTGYIRFQTKYDNSASLTDMFQIGANTSAYGVDVLSGGYRVAGTEVINSSREGTFATRAAFTGTDSAGNVTPSTDNLIVSGYGIIGNRSASVYITNSDSGGSIKLGVGGAHNANPKLTVYSSAIDLGTALQMGSTTVMDTSRNLTNIGTISSGAITTSAPIDVTQSNGNVAAPNLSNHNTGARIKLWASGTSLYSIGIEGSHIWFNSDGGYKWYEDAGLRMHLQAGGDLNLSSGGLQIGGTTVIDSSRVLQNVTANASILTSGTIDDGLISNNIHKVTTSASTAGPGNLSMGYDSTNQYSYVQSHASKPLRINPLGNPVRIGTGNDLAFHDGYHPNADKWTNSRTLTLGGDLTGSVAFDGSADFTLSAQVVNNSHNHDGTYTPLNDIRSLGTTAFTAGGGSNNSTTTSALFTEMEGDGAFDSYSSVFKTSWSYASNDNLSDAGRFTETAGTAWLTWTDNSSDTTRGNITALAIAPNTGGSAGKVFIYNDQGSGYSPGWREVWTSTSDGSGSGLDADLLDGMQPGTGNSNIAYTGSTGNLVLNDPEAYSGEVRLGAAWDYGGIYASNVLSLSTGSSTIQTIFSNSIKHTFSSDGGLELSGPLKMYGGAYEGSILFGSNTTWRAGIRQHDDADAELRIWHKNANGMIFLATGYDGEPTSISRPTDGLVVHSNNVGIGNFSGGDPQGKLHVKSTSDWQLRLDGDGTTWAGIYFVDVDGGDTLYYRGSTGTFSIGGGGSIVSNKKLHVNGGMTVGASIGNSGMPTNGLRVQGDIDGDANLEIGGISYLQELHRTNSRVSGSQYYPVGHYTEGEYIFAIDPTWDQAELQNYFNSSNVSWSADSTAPAGYAIYINGNVNVGGVYGSGFPFIPVEDGDVFEMEVWIRNAGTGQTHYMGSNEFNENFSSLGGNPGSYGYWVMSNTDPGTSWVKYTATIRGYDANAVGRFENGTKYWTPQALFNYGAGTGTRACYISGWKVRRITNQANMSFGGKAGNGQNARGRFLSIEGNTGSTDGEGSGRIFFTEHNSSTAGMDGYGMSLGYRGGSTSITGTSGNTWTGLTQIDNGEWGMWGHDGNAAGALIMSGDRAATFISLEGNDLRLSADSYTVLKEGGGNSVRAQTNYGYVDLGPQNSSWCHIQTDRASFYFNTKVTVDGGIVESYNEDLVLRRASTNSDSITINTSGAVFSRNIGVNSTINSWNSTSSVAQVGSGTVIEDRVFSASIVGSFIGSNYYRDTSGNYKTLIYGATPIFSMSNSGNFLWYTSSSVSAGATATLTEVMQLTQAGNLTVSGNVTAYSDERLKSNIETLDGSKVLQMRGVSFTKNGEAGSGVIAQELEKVAPELVSNEGEYKSVAYGNLTGYLIEAIKEQQEKIEKLEELVQKLISEK